MIADVAQRVIGLDYDESAVAHVRARYPRVDIRRGNLADLPPLDDASVEVVVNFQVIEHLWDQGRFLRECHRVLAPPGGELLVSTPPNRITFSPPAATLPPSIRSTRASSTPRNWPNCSSRRASASSS